MEALIYSIKTIGKQKAWMLLSPVFFPFLSYIAIQRVGNAEFFLFG